MKSILQYALILFLLVCTTLVDGASGNIPRLGLDVRSLSKDAELSRLIAKAHGDAGVEFIRDSIVLADLNGRAELLEQIAERFEAFREVGVEPVVKISLPESLLENSAQCSQNLLQQYIHYCEFVTRSFKELVKYWEIPADSLKVAADSKQHLKFLKDICRACKKGNPDCFVLLFYSCWEDADFAEKTINSEVGRYVDIFSISIKPTITSNLSDRLIKLRSVLDERGFKRRPLWITEVDGLVENATPIEKSSKLAKIAIEAACANIPLMFWHIEGDTSLDHALTAYKSLLESLESAKYVYSIVVDKVVRSHVFAKNDVSITAMWCDDGVHTATFEITDDVYVTRGLESARQSFVLTPVNGMITLTLNDWPCFMKCKGLIKQVNVLPGNPFQFLPPQMTATAGQQNSLGLGVVNVGAGIMTGQVRILSDLVAPNKHDFQVKPNQRILLVSKIDLGSTGGSGSVMRIPAEVEVGGRVCARLELLIRITSSSSR